MKTALLSSFEKDESLRRLAWLLIDNGWQLWGSAGTASFLSEFRIPCRDISSVVGPPILGHRVVTLARKVCAALLADTPDDFSELERLGISPIGLVYVTLYPLEKTIADANATPAQVLEKTDIGGPTLLRAAAKGRRVVLSSPAQLDEFEEHLAGGTFDEKYLISLAAAAERRVADYVDASAHYWEKKVI